MGLPGERRAAGTGAFTSDAITETISALTPLASSYSFTISHRTIAAQPATCLTVDLRPGQRTVPSGAFVLPARQAPAPS